MGPMYYSIKRLFDVISSGVAIIVLSPLLLPLIIGLKLTGEGHIFYLQERVGYKNKVFRLYKFATMLKGSSKMPGGYITTKNDPRITPMGGFLRKSKLNELPQLFNIFLGQMSVVGPRPVMPVSFEAYPADVKAVIYDSKPGLTGIGSLVFRDEEGLITKIKESGGDMWQFYKNDIYPYKGALEIWYQSHKSFWLDLKIIFLTAWVVLFPKTDVFKFFRNLPERPDFLNT